MKRWLECVTLVCVLAGCNSIGPRALEGARINYNEAIAQTWNEQLLRNLVRLKYRDTLFFLEINSVSTQYSATYSAGASPSLADGRGPALDLDAGVSLSERPTVSYTPLAGQKFVTQLLSPLSVESLILLSQSGWSMERVLGLCVQQMNNLDNASSASGPTPDYVPEYEDFQHAIRLMRKLQLSDDLTGRVQQGEDGKYLSLVFAQGPTDPAGILELKKLLGVLPQQQSISVLDGWADDSPNQLHLQTRSMLGILHFLANGVEAPEKHRAQGKVVVTHNSAGEEFDWSAITGNLLTVRSQGDRPAGAFVSTKYRGTWFYIDDADLNSKATFSFLSYLFYLQAGEIKSTGPTLTLPVGQ